MEKDTIRKRRDLLLEAQQKQQAVEKHKRQQVMGVMGDLRPHHGPCSTSADINQLLQIYTTNLGLRKALRAEIQFQKLVLNKKSPLMKVTGSVLKLFNRLLQFFGGQVLQHPPPLPDARASKCPCMELSEDESQPDDEQEDMEADAVSDREKDQQELESDFEHFEYKFFSEKGRWW